MSAQELTAMATALAVFLSKQCTEAELLLLCTFLTQLHDSIRRIVQQDELLKRLRDQNKII